MSEFRRHGAVSIFWYGFGVALLTTTEAAKRVGVCSRTLLRWLSTGALSGRQTPGGHWRIDEHTLADFMDKCERQGSQRLRVVVVEDEASEAEALVRVVKLLSPGAQVERADDGLTAGLILGTTVPHVAFVDIEMPRLDGIEVVRRAGRVRALKDTRFVVVSGRLTPERIAVLEELGVTDILRKPLRPEAISEVLAALSDSDLHQVAQ